MDPEGDAFRISYCMPHSLYLHIPFCTHRCAYCDFNTYAGAGALIPAYVDSLCCEVRTVGAAAPRDLRLHTIFFGGGTPSLLSPEQVRKVLEASGESFFIEEGAEVTLEANPGTVMLRELEGMREAGVNRISLGVQSANGEELRLLERTHDYGDVLRAVADARRAGFDNLNLDLIYGLPEQGLATWQSTVRRILELQPEHIAAYCLTLEHGTPFGQWAKRGLLPAPDPDAAADMYEFAETELRAAGYEHYEISNWARPGYRCRHNLQYWTGEPYLGLGAGAHGYAAGYRYSNVLAIREYIARLGGLGTDRDDFAARPRGEEAGSRGWGPTFPWSAAALDQHAQSIQDDMTEHMIMGLRLTAEGISERGFRSKFGIDVRQVYGQALDQLTDDGLLETLEDRTSAIGSNPAPLQAERDRRIRLTGRGRLLGNRVFREFVN